MKKVVVYASVASVLMAVPLAMSYEGRISVVFEKRLYTETSPTFGISNINFAKVGGDLKRFPPEWKDVEEADLFSSSEMETVKVFRFHLDGAGFSYAVDASGENAPAKAANLQFRPHQSGLIFSGALVALRPKSGANQSPLTLPYQIFLSEKEGYAYSRIAEYREGQIDIGGAVFPVQLHHRGPGAFRFEPENSICLIDRNRDGEFQNGSVLRADGSLLENEAIDLQGPFFLAGEPWRPGGLPSDGIHWELAPSTERTAAAVGFQAPPFAFRDLRGQANHLDLLKGKIVLIQFWSTDCYWSEKIRPEMNALISSLNNNSFAALAVVFKSGSKADIEAFLAKNPMAAGVVTVEESNLKVFNPMPASPLFYLIDGRGVIRHVEAGARQVPVLRKKIEMLLKEK